VVCPSPLYTRFVEKQAKWYRAKVCFWRLGVCFRRSADTPDDLRYEWTTMLPSHEECERLNEWMKETEIAMSGAARCEQRKRINYYKKWDEGSRGGWRDGNCEWVRTLHT
jgi:hypothetical protein